MARGAGGTPMSATTLADQVRHARANHHTLRICGAGTWLSAGRPAATTGTLDLSGHTGIVEYVPGDLTLTARAGTSLTEIASATRAEGHWLALDPHGAGAGTIGATVATASFGPLASAFGTPRDHVLGCEFVSGTGDVIRAGGRVVKNVAGFDLVRLTTGAWGTLGAITEVSLRLRARPEADETLVVAIGSELKEAFAARVATWMRTSALTPFAAELVSPTLARQLGHDGGALMLRWGGNASFASAAATEAATLGDSTRARETAWTDLARAEPVGAVVFRASTLPSRLPALWARASSFAEGAGGFAHASVSRGIVRVVVPTEGSSPDAVRKGIQDLASTCTLVCEQAGATLWPMFDCTRSSDALRAGVKRAFDPDGVMNPGLLGLP
ncbi:MAG: FAD-binding protein [Gemmatimonadaceae bacterium]